VKKALLAVVAVVVILGGEVLAAVRRDYLPTEPALEISGEFGPHSGSKLRLVVLGDSTAAGVGAGTSRQAYPTLLARRLAREGRRVRLTGLGVSGARVADVLDEQAPAATALSPDLIFVGIGANDTIHLTPLREVAVDMGRAIDLLLESGATVVVAGAPDMRAEAFWEPLRSIAGWRGRRVADVIEEEARRRGVAIVPLAERTGPFFGGDPDEHYSADLFHPSPGGYERWADAIYPVLERALADE
jgi:lysophospholipase L1-like esterase